MQLSIDQIRQSGLLEQYVIGDLTQEDSLLVEQYLLTYPTLKTDINEIEAALYRYATQYAMLPDSSLLDKIKKELQFSKPVPSPTDQDSNKGNKTLGSTLGLLLLIAAIGTSLYLLRKNLSLNQEVHEQNIELEKCKTLNESNSSLIAILQHIDAPQTQTYPIEATPNYPQTDIVIYTNTESKQNILQVNNLPELQPNESFQLWSLGESDPVPLDVFDNLGSKFLPSAYVDQSNAYAITIEKKGGSQTPNLDKLIGVFKTS